MNAKEFFDTVAAMRDAQKVYFRDRTREALNESKALEKKVDAEIRAPGLFLQAFQQKNPNFFQPMKSKVFQKITAWIQAQQEARAERRHRRALIQKDRRWKREIELLCWKFSRKPQKVSSLKYNISIEPPKISKSAREQIGLGRKFELVTRDRKRTTDGEVVSLTLHWKSPKKRRFSFSFDIAEPVPDLPGFYFKLCNSK